MNNLIDTDIAESFMERYGFIELKYFKEDILPVKMTTLFGGDTFDSRLMDISIENTKHEMAKVITERLINDNYLMVDINRDKGGDEVRLNFEFRAYVLSKSNMESIFSPEIMANRFGGI